MNVIATEIPGVLILEPKVFRDDRGFFFESFNQLAFDDCTKEKYEFVQDNQSVSMRNVLRGLHYQAAPKAQGKLVRCLKGRIFDVVVDLRQESPTRGQWIGLYLSGDRPRQLWIPPGLAHGFLALEDDIAITYKTTDYWSPAHERCIIWNDPLLQIEWPLQGEPLLSPKDAAGEPFLEALKVG